MPIKATVELDWEDLFLGTFGGVNALLKGEKLANTDLTKADNVRIFEGTIRKDSGTVIYANELSGIVQATHKHTQMDGSVLTYAITTNSLFQLISSKWKLVPDGSANTTLSGAEAAGQVALSVTSSAGFVIGSPVAVQLDDGTYFPAEVTAVAAGLVTISLPLPSPAASGKAVYQGIQLSGNLANEVQALTVPWSDEMVFTNGVDPYQIYDPLSGAFTSGGFVCKSLALFDSSILFLNLIEGGSFFPQRIRWSAKGDITNLTTLEAGMIDLFDDSDRVICAYELGPYLIVYRTNSIARAELVARVDRRFEFNRVVREKGTLSVHSVTPYKEQHLVWGHDNFYLYAGGYDLVPVGDRIKDIMFGPQGDLDQSALSTTRMVHLEVLDEVLCVYKAVEDDGPMRAARFHGEGIWTFRSFPFKVYAAGLASNPSSRTWDDLIDDWEAQDYPWNSAIIAAENEFLILGGDFGGLGYTFDYSFGSNDDTGVPLQVDVQTKDFSIPNYLTRIDYLTLKAAGGTIEVSYSLDSGDSWNVYKTFVADTVLKRYRLFKQVTGERVRFRFQTLDSFVLDWLSIRMQPETEW